MVRINRLINCVFLKLSYYVSAALKRPVFISSPLAVSIEPINICNLKCPECPTGMGILTRNKGQQNVASFQQILKNIPSSTWHLNLYFQGEPFMNLHIFEMIKYAKLSKNMVVSTSTNAQFITDDMAHKIVESGLDMLTISFDGVTQEVYEKYRVNGQLSLVIEAVQSLVKAKEKLNTPYPLLAAQFLVFKHNEHQIEEFIDLVCRLKVDKIDIKTAQLYPSEEMSNKLTSISRFSRYEIKGDGDIQLKGSFKKHCWKAWSSTVITWDGKLLPCCFDKNAEHNLGNINLSPMNQLIKDKESILFRNTLLNSQENIEICNNCPLSRK